ncbi:MAG: type II toxin-antitoxin system prevent-host-death family antitoxin [Rhodocyclales bacterium]|nr:type II toxin-antitoxin system prevent-host-death family antitoxin [Rhodocyclales bacterium]
MKTTIDAGDFKAKCLQLLDTVAAQRKPLIITKRGKPVAKLVPVPPRAVLFGALAGSVASESDIVAPVGDAWESVPQVQAVAEVYCLM